MARRENLRDPPVCDEIHRIPPQQSDHSQPIPGGPVSLAHPLQQFLQNAENPVAPHRARFEFLQEFLGFERRRSSSAPRRPARFLDVKASGSKHRDRHPARIGEKPVPHLSRRFDVLVLGVVDFALSQFQIRELHPVHFRRQEHVGIEQKLLGVRLNPKTRGPAQISRLIRDAFLARELRLLRAYSVLSTTSVHFWHDQMDWSDPLRAKRYAYSPAICASEAISVKLSR